MKLSSFQKFLVLVLILMILVVASLITVILVQESRTKRPDDSAATSAVMTTADKQTTPANTTGSVTQKMTTAGSTTEKITTEKITTAVITTLPVTTAKPPVTKPTNEYQYEFKTDLSAYEQYMNPTGDKWDDDYLLLVNPAKPLEKGGEDTFAAVAKRVEVGSTGYFTYYETLKMNEVALKALEAFAREAKANGIKGIDVCSAYRKYASQENIFNNNVSKTKKYECEKCGHTYITKASYTKCELCGGAVKQVTITKAEAEANVATYSCRPGTSEHQTGLAADLISTALDDKYLYLIEEFGDTKEGKWLAENCYKFGFILRFPEDKQEITGIIYEPWHFRFVGRYHATKIHELGMCLEEYIDYLNSFGYFEQ